jgi:hypothetical protein
MALNWSRSIADPAFQCINTIRVMDPRLTPFLAIRMAGHHHHILLEQMPTEPLIEEQN